VRLTQPVVDRPIDDDSADGLDCLKDRTLALISHDLRSPLTSIRGYVELLLDEESGPLQENQRRCLEVVRRNADRLDRQIGDLLLAASLAEGRLQLHRSAVDVARVVMEAAETAGPQAAGRGIRLEAASQSMPLVEADGARLAQVLDNLISNAIKYTPDGGRVDVRAERDDDEVVLSVSDTGIGLTAGERAAIFEPFYRSAAVKERGIKGTGLGLVIVKAVAEAHGGSVAVESEPGAGSTFTVRLPAAVPAPWMPPSRLTRLGTASR
jgi:signal transduction histidine kinase